MTALGVYAGTLPDDAREFETWLGRPVDLASAFLNQSSWAEFDNSIPWATNQWANSGMSVLWSVPLTTWYDGNLDAAATGSYNEHYLKAAQAIAATTPGTGPIYIRTGWEMNGTWFPWSAQGHEQAFVGAFQQFVDTFRSVSDRFKFEWTPNVGNDWFVHPADVYPGDAYVDVIGMDFYWNTQWEGTDPVGAWNSLVTRSSGLQWQQDFAAEHGKPTAISEWGTSSPDAGPFFQKAGQWFTQHNMLYQSYWDYTDGSYAGKLDSGQFPEAGALFQETFGTADPTHGASDASLFGMVEHSANSAAGSIYGLYAALLGRAPDPLGLEHWAQAFETGFSPRELAQALINSDEYGQAARLASTTTFVQSLYHKALGRDADPAGLQAWTDALEHGAMQADVAVGVALSPEGQQHLQSTFSGGVFVPDETASAVARLYYGLLDRSPDAVGLQGFTAIVEHGGPSLTQVAQAMLASPEFTASHMGLSDSAYVGLLYTDALGRHVDEVGLQFWTDALAQGASRAEIAVGISASTEAQQHLLASVEAGWLLHT
ncbi:DUF4214 domain-containing protein [Methylobacterium nigriterrae]|uniref:DUF4214 domain-containing protein n=1 Tax=Methylobacterium nigriterrae TaxID=3127512 RepID=UPI0030140FB3